MSKIFPTLPGIPLTKEEDEVVYRWKHLQEHSRAIVRNAIELIEGGDYNKLIAHLKLKDAVKNYIRLGGKVEDIKHFL